MKKRQKNPLLKSNSFFSIALIVVTAFVLILSAIASNMIGDSGIGYLGIGMTFTMLFLCLFAAGIPYTFVSLCGLRIEKGQCKNAYTIFKMGAIILLSIGLVISILFAFGSKPIAETLFQEQLIAMTFPFMAPILFLTIMLQYFRGYFQSFNTKMPTSFLAILECIFSLIFISIFSANFYKKGVKVGALLHNEEYGPAYGAIGAVIGFEVSLLITFLLFFLLFMNHKVQFGRMQVKDTTLHLDSKASAARLFARTYCFISILTGLFCIPLLFSIIVLHGAMKSHGTGNQFVADWGIYLGKFIPFFISASIGSITTTLFYVKQIAYKHLKKDVVGLRYQILAITKFIVMISLFGMVIMMSLPKAILSTFYAGEWSLAITIFKQGAPLVFIFSLAFFYMCIMLYTNQMGQVLIKILIYVFLHIALLFAFVMGAKLDVSGVVFSEEIAMLILAILCHKTLQKKLHYRQEYVKTFAFPFMAALIVYILETLLQMILVNVMPLFNLIICIVLGAFVYIMALFALHTIKEDDLSEVPFGKVIRNIGKTFHFL